MSNTDLDLDKLEALTRAAKATTWTAVKHSWSNVGIYSAGRPVACLSIIDDATEDNQEDLEAEMDSDAAFMVAACNALPQLIALARRASPQPVAVDEYKKTLHALLLDYEARVEGADSARDARELLDRDDDEDTQHPSVPVQEQRDKVDEPEESAEDSWRRLALQFDGHRMAALHHLRCMVQDSSRHAELAIEFLKAPPLSGEEELAKRIAALAQQSCPPVQAGARVYQAHIEGNNWMDVDANDTSKWTASNFKVRTLYTARMPAHPAQDGEDARDAKRYRWLRTQRGVDGDLPVDGDIWVVRMHQPRGTMPEVQYAGHADKLDATIDAAMAATQQGGSNG